MSDILKGETFADGETVSGGRLNALVDAATVQPGLIGDKGVATPAGGDHILIRQASSGLLKKATIAAVNGTGGNVTSVGLDLPDEFNVTGTPVTGTGTLAGAWVNQGGGKVLAAPADGSTGAPGFRRLVVNDLRLSTVVVPAAQIDWSLSNVFQKSLGGVTNFTFANQVDGEKIHVAVIHNSFLAHWPATIHWANGDEPNPTLAVSIFKFIIIGGVTYGWLEAANCHV